MQVFKNDRSSRTVVIGYFGAGNVGDDAIANAIHQYFLEKSTKIRFAIKDTNPFPDNNVETFRLTPSNLIQEIIYADRVLIAGGTHFHDTHDDFHRTARVFIGFLCIVIFAKLSLSKVLLIGHGIGPINKSWTKQLLRVIFIFVDEISVRDPAAATFLTNDLNQNNILAFDLAATLDVVDETIKSSNVENTPSTIGISVTPVGKVYFGRPIEDRKRIRNISQSLCRVVENNNISNVNIYVFHTGSEDSDTKLSYALSGILDVESNVIEYQGNLSEFFRAISKSDYFIGMRYHSIVFGYLNELPMITVPYHPKCVYFSEYVGYNPATIVDPIDNVGEFESQIEKMIKSEADYTASMELEEAKTLSLRNFQLF